MNLGQTETIDVHFAILTPSLDEEKIPKVNVLTHNCIIIQWQGGR